MRLLKGRLKDLLCIGIIGSHVSGYGDGEGYGDGYGDGSGHGTGPFPLRPHYTNYNIHLWKLAGAEIEQEKLV